MLDIIPAIDIIEGKCVRLSKGDYAQKKIYNHHPLEVAKEFEGHGLKRLHLVDLDGAKAKHVVNWKVLETIASKTNMIIDFGGGIKSDTDLKIVFDSGAEMATIGSVAAKEPDLFASWCKLVDTDKLILGADVNDKKIAVSGWLDTTDIDLFAFIEEKAKLGITKVLCTDISKDGMLQGSSIELYNETKEKFPEIYLIASGGVSSVDEIIQLDEMGMDAAIIGKAIYEGKIKLNDLEKLTR